MELRDPGAPARLGARVPVAARAALLAGPFALAFWSGGYFEGPRLVAGVVAWACVVLLALAPVPVAWPRGPVLAAIGGLALLVAWVAVSVGRAPLADAASADLQRDALYLGALVAAALAFRARRAGRAVEPAIAFGVLVVVGYGLAGRLLPGLVVEHHEQVAGGRLEQPLTYWNAMGALAALGLVLCAAIAGDRTRPVALRALAAAGASPLGLGLSLTYSRGALGALAGGLVVLVALAPTPSQLRSVAIGLEAGGLAALVASRLDGVAALHGSLAHRERDGAIVLAALAATAVAGGALQAWSARDERAGRAATARLRLPRPARSALAILVLAVAAVPYATALTARGGLQANPAFGATSQRLESLGSHRYAYWRVATGEWLDHPLGGDGPGAFRVRWLERRPFAETVRDAHSLELQTLAELGLIGLACLALAIGGTAVAARRLLRADPVLAVGPAAALAAWLVHAGVDWDWQMPALTLVAVVLAGAVLGLSETRRVAP